MHRWRCTSPARSPTWWPRMRSAWVSTWTSTTSRLRPFASSMGGCFATSRHRSSPRSQDGRPIHLGWDLRDAVGRRRSRSPHRSRHRSPSVRPGPATGLAHHDLDTATIDTCRRVSSNDPGAVGSPRSTGRTTQRPRAPRGRPGGPRAPTVRSGSHCSGRTSSRLPEAPRRQSCADAGRGLLHAGRPG